MKNYFESMTAIMSFKQVERITIYKSSIIAETANCRNEFDIDQLANYKAWLDAQANSSEIPNSSALEKLQNLITNIKTERLCDNANIPQLKWIIECWESVTGNKYELLTSDDIEDFLYECLTLLDYAGCLNNTNRGDYLIGEKSNSQEKLTSCSEKANNSLGITGDDWLDTKNLANSERRNTILERKNAELKKELETTKEELKANDLVLTREQVNKIALKIKVSCENCKNYSPNNEEVKICNEYVWSQFKFDATDDFVSKINKLINEDGK